MKKTFTLVLFVLVAFVYQANAQVLTSGFETWTNGKAAGWHGVKTSFFGTTDTIIQDQVNYHGGASAAKLVSSTSSHKRFTSQATQVISQKQYNISFWARGAGDIRTGMYTGKAGASSGYLTYNAYISVNSTSWTQYTQSLIADTTTNLAEFIFSVRNTAAASGHIQIDDVVIDTATVNVPTKTIYQIQYTALANGDSPLKDSVISVTGVVTGSFASGYWIQSGPGAWNGIYVYDISHAAQAVIGDNITIIAKVAEFNNLTELTTVSSYVKNSSGQALPAAAEVTTAQYKTEAYEGVLVKVVNAKCTNINAGYSIWHIYAGADTCKIDKKMYTYAPSMGDYYTVTGVVDYSFLEWKLNPRSAADVIKTTGIDNASNSVALNIYPNPAKSDLFLKSAKLMNKVSINDLTGKVVFIADLNQANECRLDISKLAAGMFIVTIEFNDNTNTVKRLVVN